jgi:GntR family transcriptional regulator, rspAB operon transcriptional repressor
MFGYIIRNILDEDVMQMPKSMQLRSSPGANGGQALDLKRDQVYEALLFDIICGDLRPGQLVDEATLADRYGVGRAGVRDALYRLSLEGLIERRPRLGSVITDISVRELQQVFELRVQFEGRAAALAAQNATLEEIAAIRTVYQGAEKVIEAADYRTLVQMDRAFHEAIAVATHNIYLQRVMAMLNASALRFWHYALPRRAESALREEVAAHLRVASEIERHDAEAAQKAMREVLDGFPSTVKGVFDVALQ